MNINLSLISSTLDDLKGVQNVVLTNKVQSKDYLYALIVIVVTVFVASWLSKLANKTLLKFIKNVAVRSFISKFIQYAIIIIGITAALNLIGINLAWFSVGLAIFVLMIYLTIRPLIENMGAGFLLQVRPAFSIGNRVKISDYEGQIKDITSRSTIIETDGHRLIHVPNLKVMSGPVIVYDSMPRRRSSLKLTLSLDKDIKSIEKSLIPKIMKLEGVLDVPKPTIFVTEINEDKYNVLIRWWHVSKSNHEDKTRDSIAREFFKLIK
jgi:small conductance mechanosensitive channel